MSIGGYIPLPSDALVTPVTFRVRKRNLSGILEEFDAAEDGTRELSGEWVVGKRTWLRLQKEWRATRARASPKDRDLAGDKPALLTMQQPQMKERVVLYLHGGRLIIAHTTVSLLTAYTTGAYYVSSAASHRLITIPLAKHLDARLFGLFQVESDFNISNLTHI